MLQVQRCAGCRPTLPAAASLIAAVPDERCVAREFWRSGTEASRPLFLVVTTLA